MEAPGLPDMHGFSSSFFLWLQLHCTSEITPTFPLGEVRDEFQVINVEGKQYSFSVIVLKNVTLKWKKRSNGIFKLHTISPGRGRARPSLCIWLGNPRNAKASVLVQTLTLQNDSHMVSTAMFRDTPYKSFHICFCLAPFIPCSHPDVRKSFPSHLSPKDANSSTHLLASHTSTSLSHRLL